MLIRKLSERLTDSRYIPWRFRYRGGPLNTLIEMPLRKLKLQKKIQEEYAAVTNDITLIIGIKGRINYRLENTLTSIEHQSYPRDLISVKIVDYDNSVPESNKLKEISRKYGCEVIRVENQEIWNKSHCLNVAIKQTTTKYLMPIDADIILSPNYIDEVVNNLRLNPLGMVLSEMLDLPAELGPLLEMHSKAGVTPQIIENLRKQTFVRKTHSQLPEHRNIHISLHATYTFFYHLIRGYDEHYTLWGSEDNDIYRRFFYFGLTPSSVHSTAFYMHQWHPKHQSLTQANLNKVIKSNHQYFTNNHSIIRNENHWGEL